MSALVLFPNIGPSAFETGEVRDSPQGGRLKKTSPEEEQFLILALLRNCRISSREFGTVLSPLAWVLTPQMHKPYKLYLIVQETKKAFKDIE